MAVVLQVAVLFVAGCAWAFAFHPVLKLGRGARLVWIWTTGALLLASPRLIAGDHPFARFLAAISALAFTFKVADLHIGATLGLRPTFGAFAGYVVNPGSAVLRKLHQAPRTTRTEDLKLLAAGGLAAAASASLFAAVVRVDWAAYPFALEHSVKVLSFFLVVLTAAPALEGLFRLVGFRVVKTMNRVYLSATPAELWNRYNLLVHQLLYENVFRVWGGRRAPVRGTLAAFAVSAAAHEYLFSVATGRVRGLQAAFFLIQGAASAATLRVRPKGWRRAVGIVATLAFNLVTSVLFFDGINRIAPFYAPRP